jgi:fluoroquinolone transport system ATP-binding protein
MIHVDSLRFSYPKQSNETIRGISFNIEPGQIFGFLGPSGSGKSTTQKILIGLLKDFQGDLRIMDRDARDWKQDLYYHIGVGFELPNHFSKLSGLENLKLFASFYEGDLQQKGRAEELLELVDLQDAAKQPVGQYSKGMKMRLNFARALLNDPELLFLDEPTAGLDPTTARRIKDVIQELQSRGKTIFLTTHNMHDADELCDRVAFIVEGELKVIDEPNTLKLQHGSKTVKVLEKHNSGENPVAHEFPLESLGSDTKFLDLLKQQKVESIHSQEASLEEVFIEATGTQLQ